MQVLLKVAPNAVADTNSSYFMCFISFSYFINFINYGNFL